ncbi:hypothetical protein M9H77_29530 [Catharanthus roseus]|uniref:Uncharacterized protein n=1 Tax=Catharanthus roseus TaxID=4058 RepID=A0ACB9ZYW9_CATRO|nr:hypothetical protein M9H77_29530 [Catharanthus roseus]
MMKGNENARKQNENDENRAIDNETANHTSFLDSRLKDIISRFQFQLGNWKDELGRQSGFQLQLREKRDFPLRIVWFLFIPRKKRGELVLFDPEPKRMLWDARGALQFGTAGTSAITLVVKAKEEQKALPYNNSFHASTSNGGTTEQLGSPFLTFKLLKLALQSFHHVSNHAIIFMNLEFL